jgi:hypothetical protein
MKYKNELEIHLPLDRVIELFDNPENLKKWMPGLVSFETISGTQGQPEAKSLLKYEMGKRKIEMVETILTRNLLENFSGTYETKGIYNVVRNSFRSIDKNTTLLINENEF